MFYIVTPDVLGAKLQLAACFSPKEQKATSLN